jgi:hypothetical protein
MTRHAITTLAIRLTEAEQTLFDSISFTVGSCYPAQENGEKVLALFRSLAERGAIPEIRRRYFTDPELFVSNIKGSRREVYERNGTAGRDIPLHPSFLKHLRYFICGPSLPQAMISRFQELVSEPFAELEKMRVYVRAQVRHLPEDFGDASEEVFKLALESGLPLHKAKLLRKDAKNAAGMRSGR